ncbi:Uncharacterised protein [Mycobacteroides abscessus subsp. abscessus]|nr:Uncharacterised protein [Mycobacteroides abscessus subsp. abscessus]
MDSSSGLIATGPRVNEPRFWSLIMSARLWLPWPEVPGLVNERMPSRTAMSTVGVTPTAWMSLTNAVFGEVASASVTDIGDL